MSACTRGSLHGPGRGDREQPRCSERAPDAGQLPPDGVCGHQPDKRYEHERDPDPLDAVARQQGQSLQQDVEAGRLRRVDVRSQLLPVAERVEGGEIDALVVVRGRLHAPDVDERRDSEQPGQPERLAKPRP